MPLFFLKKIIKIGFRNEYRMLFFLKDVIIAQKTKFLIFFTSKTNIEWIKASPIDMHSFHKKRKFNNVLEVFLVYL
jgi:hypothetical protein